ncbi:MAG: DUF885 domain-containing protein [Phycisphaerales bacterium]|nr:DUF885 domain-containing protein [Phycisphaerales bacterium]
MKHLQIARFTLFILLILATKAVGQSYLPDCPADRDPGLWSIMNQGIELAYQADPISVGPLLKDESRNDQLADMSAKAIKARLGIKRGLLADLKALDRTGFVHADQLAAELLIYQWEKDLRLSAFKQWQVPITSISGPQVWLPQMSNRVPMQTDQHRKDYLTRLKRVPIYIGDQIDNMRLGMADGRVPPRVTIEAAAEQAMAQASRDFREDASLSPFYKPFLEMDQNDPIAIEARQVIALRIVPVYQELAVFIQNEYMPACRDSIGAAQGIDGVESYNALIASHTTLPGLSADEIHAIGLREVKRIRGEMAYTILFTPWYERTLFTYANPPWGISIETIVVFTNFADGSQTVDYSRAPKMFFEMFFEHLRTDPEFYYTKPDDLLNGYKAIAKTIDGELPKLFKVLPSLPYGVRALPAFSAESAPTAYYYPGSAETGRAGNFVANLSLLDQRPKYEMLALTLHEAMPGHHLQIALAQEIKEQHPIRKTMGFTGFVEGWGLYAEKLGLEMGEGENGLYNDPYDNFGRLNFEMWRAMRLVVDTGMHAKGWSRDQAVEFMRTNSALAEHNIEAEINRYIGWPGQATGYKIGELKILEIRAKAEAALGDDFDIRAFHEELLNDGAIPLPVLDKKMSQWIESHRLTD